MTALFINLLAITTVVYNSDMNNSVNFLKLIDDYDSNSIRSALVQHWARCSGVTLNTLKSNSITRKILDTANSQEVSFLLHQFGILFPLITLKDIEKTFEIALDKQRRISYGMVYTPEYIIDYLIKNSLFFTQKTVMMTPKICDPACGCGGFLLKTAEILEKHLGISGERAFSESIFGIDIDGNALEQARCLIELYLASKNQTIPNLDNSLIQLDTLIANRDQILSFSNHTQGFDVIVTNPPYVKFQNLNDDYRQTLAKNFNGLANGNFSLSVLFLIKGFDLLSPQGSLGMITQNNLFTSLAGKNIRDYLQKQECIRRVIDFGHRKVFDNASAYTCLIFLSKEKVLEFDYATISNEVEINIDSLEKLIFSKISILGLNPSKWRLSKDFHLDNLKKIESVGKPLREVADIKVGFATLKDSVFFVRDYESGTCLATSPDGRVFQIEREITRGAVKVSELKSVTDLKKNNRRIIFPYFKHNGVYKLIPEQSLMRDFPEAYAYLLASRDLLGTRDKGKKQYGNWFAWARTQGMEAPAPKLLTKTFSKFPQFFLDTTDQLFCNGYSVSSRSATLFESSIPIEVLELILNSKIMYYYAKLTSFKIEGDYQCYQKNFIEKFGIPNLDPSAISEIINMYHRREEVDKLLASIYDINFNEILDVVSSG